MHVNGCGALTCGPVFSLERRRRRDFTTQPVAMALQWRGGAKREKKSAAARGWGSMRAHGKMILNVCLFFIHSCIKSKGVK